MPEELSPDTESENKKIYNKLIRDRIPEIIAADGATCELKTLNNEEFIQALSEKLIEEAQEFSQAQGKKEQIKELADVMEIIKTLQKELDINPHEVEEVRQARQYKRGGFDKKLFLISTEGGNYGQQN